MIKKILLGIVIMLMLSCEKTDNNDTIKQGKGSVWHSGGLAHCAEQIRIVGGEILVVINFEEILPFITGDSVYVKYKEKGVNEFCPPNIDCEIIEIRKVE